MEVQSNIFEESHHREQPDKKIHYLLSKSSPHHTEQQEQRNKLKLLSLGRHGASVQTQASLCSKQSRRHLAVTVALGVANKIILTTR